MPSPKRLIRRLLGLDRDERPALAPVALISAPVPATPEPTPDDDGGAPAIPAAPDAVVVTLPISDPERYKLPAVVRSAAPLRQLDPRLHAQVFLDWLQGVGGLTGDVLACDLIVAYREMCLDLGLEERRWNAVSPHFKALGATHRYVWHQFEGDAEKSRLRQFTIPSFTAAADPPWPELPLRRAFDDQRVAMAA